MNKTIHFSVTGMHCQSCELLISEELKETAGVSDVKIDHKSGKGSVVGESQLGEEKVLAAIKKAGYQAVITTVEVPTVKAETKAGNSSKSFKEVVITKGSSSGSIFNPIKVVLNSHFEAEGNVVGNESGILQVEGKMNSHKNAQFIIPDGREAESLQYIQKFMNTNGGVIPKETPQEPVSDSSKQVAPALTPHISTGPQRYQLSLSGMHCSSCAGLIEQSLKKVPGVKEANVNFAAEKASVVLDETQSSKESLLNAVKKTGYGATFVNDKDGNFHKRAIVDYLKIMVEALKLW